MDAVCQGKQWDVALAYGKDGRIAGALPYLLGRKGVLRYILQPQLTQYNGPWYNYGLIAGKGEPSVFDRLQFEQEVAEQLVASLKQLRLVFYSQCFSPSVTNWQPFYEHGYSQTTRYTYRIEDISDPQRVFADFIPKRQRKILKWQSSVSVDVTDDADWFASYHSKYWQSKGQNELLPHSLMVRLCQTAMARNAGVIFRLRSEDGHPVAAAFMPYDSHAAYLLQSAYSLEHYHNAHVILLIWNAIQWLSSRTRSFDFEGSMIPGVAYFNRTFGAVPIPYFQITKYSNGLVRRMVECRSL